MSMCVDDDVSLRWKKQKQRKKGRKTEAVLETKEGEGGTGARGRKCQAGEWG